MAPPSAATVGTATRPPTWLPLHRHQACPHAVVDPPPLILLLAHGPWIPRRSSSSYLALGWLRTKGKEKRRGDGAHRAGHPAPRHRWRRQDPLPPQLHRASPSKSPPRGGHGIRYASVRMLSFTPNIRHTAISFAYHERVPYFHVFGLWRCLQLKGSK